MEQFQDPFVAIHLMQRRQGTMAELAASLLEHALEVSLGDRLAHERAHHPVGQFVIGQRGPVGDVLGFEQRQFDRDKQPTIFGDGRQHDFFEIDLHGGISGTHVAHGQLRKLR